MINLFECDEHSIGQWGRELLNEYGDSLTCFEEAAQVSVQHTYDHFRLPNGDPLFALFRVYRISRHDDLAPDLKNLASGKYALWLALMATIGEHPDWNNRHNSRHHRVLPMSNELSPMFRAAFEQFGLPIGDKPIDDHTLSIYQSGWTKHVFHIEHVAGSHYIPDQQNFIEPYGIQSVVGIGSPFPSGMVGFAIGFTTTPLAREHAQKFAALTPFLFTLLARYDDEYLWMR